MITPCYILILPFWAVGALLRLIFCFQTPRLPTPPGSDLPPDEQIGCCGASSGERKRVTRGEKAAREAGAGTTRMSEETAVSPERLAEEGRAVKAEVPTEPKAAHVAPPSYDETAARPTV
ncbi:hypothetical protein MNV49_000849 [Pseudohyphozyma bogoriensis]|nr:hypothetical protein MNV49_000849 [Pseudohyphozyma bogoriensis]